MTVIANAPVIESPCVRICAVDPASQLCMGCGRNLDEITRWYGMSGDERQRVMAVLPDRIEALRQAYLNRNKRT
jgi:predicted Fe-S protein YdhL (DUF1289 family)